MKETTRDLLAGKFNGPGEALEQILTIADASGQVVKMGVDRKLVEWFPQQ